MLVLRLDASMTSLPRTRVSSLLEVIGRSPMELVRLVGRHMLKCLGQGGAVFEHLFSTPGRSNTACTPPRAVVLVRFASPRVRARGKPSVGPAIETVPLKSLATFWC